MPGAVMNLEQAVVELENMRTDPVSAIEFLIAQKREAEDFLVARLLACSESHKPPFVIAVAPPHPLPHRIQFRFPRGIYISATKAVTRRIVIALGAMRSTIAVPVLLNLVAHAPLDVKLGEAVGWALANIGDTALLPMFSFARQRLASVPARSLTIAAIGYIADPRVPTILNHLWREYRLEAPSLSIAALLGLTMCGHSEEVCIHIVEMRRLWRARGLFYDARRDVESAMDFLHRVSENTHAVEALPAWPSVVQILGRR